MKVIPLHGEKAAGRVALVDDADYRLVMAYRWYVFEDPRAGGPYAQANTRRSDGVRTTIKMHKLITGRPQTDHKDHDGLNNQRWNLRDCNQHGNQANERKGAGCSSRFKGVTWNKQARKWQAQIKVHGRNRYLGLHVIEEDAARAYDTAAREAFGEFAWLNFGQP